MGLYLEQLTSDPAAIIHSDSGKRIVLHFLRSVDVDRWREGWREGFAKDTPDLTPLADQIARLNDAMRDLEAGDSIAFTFNGDSVPVTVHNEKSIEIEGKIFQRALLRIWLA